jgi:hypothetical protein
MSTTTEPLVTDAARERGHRIRFALDGIAFGPLMINDPVPLGRQILEEAGAHPPQDFSLFAILDSGDFEDIRLDETVDLRKPGAERFIAFRCDRIYRMTLDDRQIAWGLSTISGQDLLTLADAGPGKAVFLEVRGGTDRPIGKDEQVDLTQAGVEAFITADRPRSYKFFVNGEKYETDQEALTGLQIKARVTDWDPSHDLVLEGHGNEPDRVIGDDELVHLDVEHGPRRFSSVPKANFG